MSSNTIKTKARPRTYHFLRKLERKVKRSFLPSKAFARRVMASMDRWVSHHPWACGGWVDPNRVTADYQAVFSEDEVARTMVFSPHPIQQVRSEIMTLVEEILRRGRTQKIVEVGMGVVGGSHRLWSKIFDRVVTVELLYQTVNRFIIEEGPDLHQSEFVIGDSRDPDVIRRSALSGQDCDVLFIDGDHTYAGVEADYRNYIDLVKPGGLVVFHDTQIDGPPNIQVRSFVDNLESGKVTGTAIQFTHIRHSKCVGISFFEKK